MATHSIILAWKIPWTEETGRLQSMESQKSYTNEGNKTAGQKSVTYANPHITRLRPDDSFSSFRNGILN